MHIIYPEKRQSLLMPVLNPSIFLLMPLMRKFLAKLPVIPTRSRVFQGIEAAVKAGMNVKLNAVIMRGKNDSQIIPLLDYASDLGVKIRFLELMKMGHLYHSENSSFFPEEEILSIIRKKYDIEQLPRKTC